MSNNIEIEGINWIEEAISKKHIKYYEYEYFYNIKEIGTGGFGKVCRAKWKHSNKYLALKSFYNFNDATVKEVVHELKLHREVDFNDNIIRFYGITASNQENENSQSKNYLLVMEYADGPMPYHVYMTRESFTAICTPRIGEGSKSQASLYGVIPYVDPRRFMRRRKNNENKTQLSSLDEKSDIYSIGVLLWEISSGKPPFYVEDEQYDIDLALEISQGLRETIVPNTPVEYSNLYIECWDNDPDNRPTISQVVDKLKSMNPTINVSPIDQQAVDTFQTFSKLQSNSNSIKSVNTTGFHGELSQMMQNFNNLNIEEMIVEPLTTRSLIVNKNVEPLTSGFESREQNKNISSKNNFNLSVEEIYNIIFKLTNEGKEWNVSKYVLEYFNNHNINSREIYYWIINNQNDSIYNFLLGCFNYYGIGIDENRKEAFNLFINASKKNHILADYYIGLCYEVLKNEKLAFKYYEKAAKNECVAGEFKTGYCYYNGIGKKKGVKMAAFWCKKAAYNGHLMAMYYLAHMYKNGRGVKKDYDKAFELFKISAEGEYANGIMMLGYCYECKIGTDVDKQKVLELYQKSANLGSSKAQYILASMYSNGKGIARDMVQAIYWYEKAMNNGYLLAMYDLANIYRIGSFVEKDYDKAFKLFKKLAEEEHMDGMTMLGFCYSKGIGTYVDKQMAFKLYQKVAKLGNYRAQYNLALMYNYGIGTKKDLDKAVYWYEMSANQGFHRAQSKFRILTKIRNSYPTSVPARSVLIKIKLHY
ncbi:kinase-like domain-containing protein [Rhizophagus irregularis DAOM 181602=DAOM 197198]|nr:kinase-like domain-containing protein [Rhizophagus irregularis DAOM 181602=DAOM 197198]